MAAFILPQTVQENQYDARAFRTVIKSYTSGTLSETRHSYFTSDWRCVEERTGTSTTADRQFVWGVRYVDALVLRDRGVERFYALQDANWNVASIADASGGVQERYVFTPYGSPLFLSPSFGSRTSSSYDWETLYCGYRYRAGSGLYHVRNRFFHPSVGSWCQRDPSAYVNGMSLYAAYFVPSGIDPYGLDIIDGILENACNLQESESACAFGSSIGNSVQSMGQFYYSLGQYAWGNSEGGWETMCSANANSSLGQAQNIGPGTYRATALSLGVATAAAVAAGGVLAAQAAGAPTMQAGCRLTQHRCCGGRLPVPHFAWKAGNQGWLHARGIPGFMEAEAFPHAANLGYGGMWNSMSGIPILNSANATTFGGVQNCFWGTCTAWYNGGGLIPAIGIGVPSVGIGYFTCESLKEATIEESPF